MYDEDYIVVEAWDDQTGCWYSVDEFKTENEAFQAIGEMHSTDDVAMGFKKNYSVLHVKRTVIKGS